MSKQSVTAFRSLIAAEPALADEVRGIVVAGSGTLALVALARSRGFEFTAAEADEAMAEDELSELELELISAGTPINCNLGGSSVPVDTNPAPGGSSNN